MNQNNKIKIFPSILSSDFSKLGEEIKIIEKGGADGIHCDIMDGHFVPNITYGPMVVEMLNNFTELPLDVHLMINNSDRYIDDFVKAGANYISVHYENNYHIDRLINFIKSKGVSRCCFESCNYHKSSGKYFANAGFYSDYERKSRVWRTEIY